MDRSKVALIIPAFNEQETIQNVVKSCLIYGQPIVVDDCSTDLTSERAVASGAIVLRHQFNKGYDGALNTGFAEAYKLGYDYLITLDADGQHDPALIEKFIAKLKNQSLIVLGIRDKKARFSEYLFGFYTFLRYGVSDPLCGMKGYHRSIYEKLGWFDSYQSIGTELMIFALKNKFPFEQVNFKVKRRLDSPRFGKVFSANIRIIRALLKAARG